MGKQPYIPFYVGDYLKDTRILPLAVRGAWVDLILYMWDSPTRGELTGTIEDFARLMSCEKKEAEFALNLLKQKGIADFTLFDDGQLKIVSRKMKRDAEISKIRSDAGKNGVKVKANNKFAEAKQQTKGKQNTEYEYVIENENEILTEYENWTNQIVEGNDQMFEQMFMKEAIPQSPNIQFWIYDHRDLLNRYPKMRPPNQQAFRQSCIKHIRENYKKQPNGKVNGNSKEQQSAATSDYLKQYYSNRANGK